MACVSDHWDGLASGPLTMRSTVAPAMAHVSPVGTCVLSILLGKLSGVRRLIQVCAKCGNVFGSATHTCVDSSKTRLGGHASLRPSERIQSTVQCGKQRKTPSPKPKAVSFNWCCEPQPSRLRGVPPNLHISPSCLRLSGTTGKKMTATSASADSDDMEEQVQGTSPGRYGGLDRLAKLARSVRESSEGG
jgi:hypothetical protein